MVKHFLDYEKIYISSIIFISDQHRWCRLLVDGEIFIYICQSNEKRAIEGLTLILYSFKGPILFH